MTGKVFQKVAVFALMSILWLAGATGYAQNRPISGTVVDQDGQPIIGASVMVIGNSRLGTVTDVNGAFSLSVPNNANLSVSCIGYKTETFVVGSQSSYRIILEEDNEFIEETVVIGYGVQRKSDVTGAISQVKAEDMENRSTNDAAQALQGKTSGVQIIQTSAAPGSSGTIRVRGYSSNSASDPLIIVDGLTVSSIDYLDPNLIESIEVLKDAASAAIYGAQAGNGVILITTKSGSSSRDGRVFFDAQYTLNSLAKIPEVMNAEQYVNYMTEAGFLTDAARALWDGKTDTNWSKVAFTPSPTQRYTVGFQGGNDKGSLFTSITYLDQDGIVRGQSDIFKRLTAQINAEYKVKSWLTVGINSSFEKREVKNVSENSEYGSLITSVLNLDPLTPNVYSPNNLPATYLANIAKGRKYLTDENGDYYGISLIAESEQTHPFVQRDNHDDTSNGMTARGTLYANFTPIKNLVVTSRFGYQFGFNNSSSYSFPFYANGQNKSDTYSLSATARNTLNYQWENFANYSFNVGKNTFGAMIGMSFMERSSNYVTGSGDQLRNYAPNFRYLSYLTTDCNDSTSGVESLSRNLAYLGRLSWSYDNRYNVQVNFRADAFDSSKLSKENRWGYFPSISAGWTISNEKFAKSLFSGAFNYLKLRASWGRNGNVNILSGYPYTSTINVGGAWAFFDTSDAITLGSYPNGLANPNLTWETSTQYDFGIDARFLNNRLTATLDWYDKRTDGLLVRGTPVMETGQGSVTLNAGKVLNQGLELELGWRDDIGDFHYSINGNISTLKNRVTYLDPSVKRLSGTSFFDWPITYFEEGYPVWYMRGYKFTGVDKQTGEPMFEDYQNEAEGIQADGVINGTDQAFYIGCAIPDFTYGITLNAAWKGFDLTVFGTGTQGNDIVSCLHRVDRPMNNNLSIYYTDRWTPSHTDAKHPKAGITNEVAYWHSSAQVYDGSFFKIKQIQFGYTLPRDISKKLALTSARAYVSLDDYFTFTTYPGFDPEASSGSTSAMGVDKGSFPPTKKFVFGLNLSF